MQTELFLQERHPHSGRHAFLEEQNGSAFLYLTEAGSTRIVRDSLVYLRVAPDPERPVVQRRGEPPVVRPDVVTPAAVLPGAHEAEFTFRWARDGNAVAVLRSLAPVAFVAVTEPRGFTRAVNRRCSIANPWDDKKYEAIFAG